MKKNWNFKSKNNNTGKFPSENKSIKLTSFECSSTDYLVRNVKEWLQKGQK